MVDFGIFKRGQRVECIEIHDNRIEAVGVMGTIIGFIDAPSELGNICVKFDKFINGHDGCRNRDAFTKEKIEGERGYYWYLPHYKLKLLNKNKRI